LHRANDTRKAAGASEAGGSDERYRDLGLISEKKMLGVSMSPSHEALGIALGLAATSLPVFVNDGQRAGREAGAKSKS
jgi:hypothetical protein